MPAMPSPPTGLLALAFTDIQGSTPLWDENPEVMRHALDIHDRLLRKLLAEHEGYEFSAEGDALKVAFSSALNAVRFSLAVQLALQEADWPEGLEDCAPAREEPGFRGLRVRIGVHLGEPICRPHPESGQMDYFGPCINRAARIGDAPHGGQLVVSAGAWELVRNHLPETEFLDLGLHHLKGLEEPEHLYEIRHRSLHTRRFPPLRTQSIHRTNLPNRLTSFVGRQPELAQMAELLARPGVRIATLLGPGGTGKTRLCQKVGSDHLARYPGGVWFCDLTEARDAAGVCQDVARALSVPLAGGNASTQLGNAILGRGRTLIILDNFEQVVSAAAHTVAQWLDRAPQAQFLVTSRERLGIEGEHSVPLEPLAAPDEEIALEDLARVEGVSLFVQRARLAQPNFNLTADNAHAVAGIVRLLDGLPLALELAAARVRTLAPSKMLGRMTEGGPSAALQVLRGRRRDLKARQATMREAIAWSWQLLEGWEQAAMAQCAVFRGAFSMEAAEAVLDLSCWPEAPIVDEILESLADKSLLRTKQDATGATEIRFGIYETIRFFAMEHLESPEALVDPSGQQWSGYRARAETWSRHGAWYAKLGTPEMLDSLRGPTGPQHFRELALDLENLVAAVARAPANGPMAAETAVGAGLAAMALLDRQGPLARGVGLGAGLLARSDLDTAQRLKVLTQQGKSLVNAGRVPEAQEVLQWALGLATSLDDPEAVGLVRTARGVAFRRQGRYEEAENEAHTALALLRGEGLRRQQGGALDILGLIALRSGRLEEAERHFREAVTILEESGDRHSAGMVLLNLGHVGLIQGRPEAARTCYQEALTHYQAVGARRNEGVVRGSLASLAALSGDVQAALKHYNAALVILREVGNRRSEGIVHGNLADLLLGHGDLEGAREHLGAALEQTREASHPQAEGAFLGSLGELERREGRRTQAREALETGEGLLRQTGNQEELGKLLCRRGLLDQEEGASLQARTAYEEALVVAEALDLAEDAPLRGRLSELAKVLDL